MEKTIDKILQQQTEIFELFDNDEISPIKNPPITKQNLEKLKTHWSKLGGSMPADYEAFLKICDGIENFSLSYHLFGSEMFFGQDYLNRSAELLKDGTGLQYETPKRMIFIGWHDETRTRIFYDFNTQIPVLYDGEPGFLSKYESFAQYLNLKAIANEMTISKLSNAQNEVPDEDE